MTRTLLFAIIFVLTGLSRAQAAPVSYNFTGFVETVGGTGMFAGIQANDSLIGTLSFDDATPNNLAGDPTRFEYLNTGRLSMTISGISFEFGSSIPTQKIIGAYSSIGQNWNLVNAGGDFYGSTATANGIELSTLVHDFIFFALQDNPDIFPSTGSPLPLTSFFQTQALIYQNGVGATDTLQLSGHLLSFELSAVAVPLPGALPLLFTSGLLAIFGARRRRGAGKLESASTDLSKKALG